MVNYSRSRGGCATCKRKHIKCDEARPHCKKCTSKHLACPGYTQQFIWKQVGERNPGRNAAKKRKVRSGDSSSSSWDVRSVASSTPERETSPLADQEGEHGEHDKQTRVAASPIATLPEIQAVCVPESFESLQPDTSVTGTEETAEETIESFLAQSSSSKTKAQDLACPELTSTLGLDDPHIFPDGDALFSLYFPEQWTGSAVTMGNDDLTQQPGLTPKMPWEGLDDFSMNDETQANSLLPCEADVNTEDATIFDGGVHQLPNNTVGYPTTGWSLSPMPFNNTSLDPSTKQRLTLHYFESICQILSCFDSHENPFRSDIPRVMLTCDYVHDCIIGMSAAHLANLSSGMESIALNHQARAMAGLSLVIQSIQPSGRPLEEQVACQDPFARSARYQALLAAMLLGISSAWYDASAASIAHLTGARSLFQAWLLDEGMSSGGREPVLLNRHQSFLVGAMVYLECLASFIFDQPVDSLKYLRRFSTLAKDQRVYPNPWTGVSTPLFVHLAETAVLMRCKRTNVAWNPVRPKPRSHTEFCENAASSAKNLYEKVLRHTPPAITRIDDTKDSDTPVDHLVSMDIIYRLVILMELVQAFPRLTVGSDCETNDLNEINSENQINVLDCAVAILTVVSHIPEASGANIMLSIPLIAAGSALQPPRPPAKTPRSPQTAPSPPGLRTSISAIMHDQYMLGKWRQQTQSRLERTYRRVGVAPLRWASHLVQEVWRRVDMAWLNENYDAWPAVHWMEIMIDEKLETLFG